LNPFDEETQEIAPTGTRRSRLLNPIDLRDPAAPGPGKDERCRPRTGNERSSVKRRGTGIGSADVLQLQ
jgi:hypothetical protein